MEKVQVERQFWPEEILRLPRVETPVAGAEGYTLVDGERQVTFLHFDEGTVVPDHSHAAQWGYLVRGEMVLEIDGRSELYQDGDVYYIPAGTRHRTVFTRESWVIDMGEDPTRYPVHRER